jgi:hypothetical protein
MFSCNKCCFAEMKDGNQISCFADKYKYVKAQNPNQKNDKVFFELDRVCLYKRSKEWESSKSLEEKLKEVESQLVPNIGFCIDDDSDNPDDLVNLLEQFIKIDYPKNRIFITIYSNFNKAGARIPKLLSNLRANLITNCCCVFKVEDNTFENETSIFQKMLDSTLFARVSSKSKVDLQKSLSTINKKLNNELAKLLLIKNEDVLFISKTYVSKNYLKYKDYNKMQADLFKKVQGTEFIHNII